MTLLQVNDNAQKVAQEGGIVPLIQLLKNWLPSVLTSAMKSLAQLGQFLPFYCSYFMLSLQLLLFLNQVIALASDISSKY